MKHYHRLGMIGLLSTVAFAAADNVSGSGAASMPLIDALRLLDFDNADHWNKDGSPSMDALQHLTGDKTITREDVDKITNGAKRPTGPADAIPDVFRAPATNEGKAKEPLTGTGTVSQGTGTGAAQGDLAPQVPSKGRIVTVFAGGGASFDGDAEAAAIVARVNDDGSLNVRVISPNGGADQFVTGLKTKAELDALPEGDAGRNVSFWDWPART